MINYLLDTVANIVKYKFDRNYLNWYFFYSKKLLQFRNIHKGEDCFIIGNGPSLNKMDLTPLNNYTIFGLNKIYLLLNRIDLDISYHVAVNSLVIEQSVNEFNKLKCPLFLSYRPEQKNFRNMDHIYFLATDSCFPAPYSFQTDLLHPLAEGYTVTYVAMQIAFYMGFKNVFLVGVDHNFKAAGKPNEEQLFTGEDHNHFDPGYFSNQQWHLPDLEASELSYHLAKFFYNRAGRQIYDATVDGKLQIFPKISFEQALTICNNKRVN